MGHEKAAAELRLRSRRLIGLADGDSDPVVEHAIDDAIAAGFTSPRHVANMAMTSLGMKSSN
jgi:hypothetical protein